MQEEQNLENKSEVVENQEEVVAQEQEQVADEQSEVKDEVAEEAKTKKSRFGFGGKKAKDNLSEINKKLTEDLSEANNKIEELQDKYMRQVAEYSNFKKRTAKEKLEIRENVKASMLLEFLPVIDDIDLAMKHLESSDVDATKEGVKLIYQKFMDFLRSQELSEINAMGEEFSTDFHEAVTQFPVEDEDKKGKVIDVIQKGYKINDKVVRYSKVVVGQ